MTELPELPEKELPEISDIPENESKDQTIDAQSEMTEMVDEDQYSFYDVPEDGEDMFTMPE